MILAILASSCQTEKIENDSEKAVQATKTYTFTVQDKEWTAEGDVTRTAYTPGTGLKVTGNELISLFYVDGSGEVVGSNMGSANSPGWKAEPTATAGEYSFTGPVLDGTYKCYAIMPYSYKNLTLLKKTSGNKTVSVGLSNVQYPAANSFDPHFDFMVGRPFDLGTEETTATVTSFKRLFSPFRIIISGLDEADKIFAVTAKFTQLTDAGSNSTLTGLFNLSLGENFEDVTIVAAHNYSSGNGLTALYPEGLSKGTEGWPVWFVVNPVTFLSGTELHLTVSTENKTYRRTIILPSELSLLEDRFNEIRVNIKGSGFTESDSFTQFFIPESDYTSGSATSLTASDGVSRDWVISGSKTCWNTEESTRDNGSGLPNGFYLYTNRFVKIPSVSGRNITRATVYAHPNTQSYSTNAAQVLTLNDGSSDISTVYFNQTSKSIANYGLYKNGGYGEFIDEDMTGWKIVGSTYINVISAMTFELDVIDLTLAMSDGIRLLNNPWPLTVPSSESSISSSWNKDPLNNGTRYQLQYRSFMGGGYSFYAYGTTALARNSKTGLIIGTANDDYLEFPAIEGYKLSKVSVRWGRAGERKITDTAGNVVSGGESKSFNPGEDYTWTLSETIANTAYQIRITNDTGRMDLINIRLRYIPE